MIQGLVTTAGLNPCPGIPRGDLLAGVRAVGACALPLRAAAGSRARTAAVAHGEGGLCFIVFFAMER
jgi:hypothetical protein